MPGPVLFIVGPTASGKTDAALKLAAACTQSIEIVNADSRQVYRGMSIGTAKPTLQEQAAVPHHLIDVADPYEGFSLATFLNLARSAITTIQGRNVMPLVVGGTGQYVWGLVEGWQVPEVAPQEELRARLEREAEQDGGDVLHARLARLDPEAADLIDPRNVRRTIRALEVIEATGEPFSSQRRKVAPDFEPIIYGLNPPRTELYARIDERVDAMVDSGWIDEVRTLLDEGCRPELPAFSSVGYREITAHIAGELTLEDAKTQIKNNTHRLARSQGSWFKGNDPRIAWHESATSLVIEAQMAIDLST